MRGFFWMALLGGMMSLGNTLGANEAADRLRAFMETYQADYHQMHCDISYSWWDAMVTGNPDAFEKSAVAQLAMATYHADSEPFRRLGELRAEAAGLSPLEERAAREAYRAFEQSQIPPELTKKMIDLSNEIEQVFQTQRATLNGKEFTNNELLEMLHKETDSQKRFAIWDALKQVGPVVAPRLGELAKLRNESAELLGYKNYWEMKIAFQDYDPAELIALFENLEKQTTPIFSRVKAEMDAELKQKFGVETIMPWHYDNPFFQQAPPSAEINLNLFYEKKSKEEIVAISKAYCDSIGLEVAPILEKSDLFEKPGKTQHGFCNNMNGEGDVRILCNIKPTADWMDTQLHELGHAVYDYEIDRSLPFNLRSPAHIFTTEGVAMLFGANARNPKWLVEWAGVDESAAKGMAAPLKKQRLREQLLFCRWTLVMFHFERALYENPDADLATLWWDTVEQYQQMPRPKDRHKADWASKPHFVIAPVYYHNYMLGELFAAQLRQTILKNVDSSDPKSFGKILTEKVFLPGSSTDWKIFVREATGEEFSPRFFADELK